MNILLLCHEFGDFGGGAGNAARQIAAELVRAGHGVHAITSNFNGTLPRWETVAGVEVHRVPGWRRSALENRVLPTFASYLLAGAAVSRRVCRQCRPDVVHAFFTVPAGLVGRYLAASFGASLVVSLRGSDVPYYVPDRVPSAIVRRLVQWVWNGSDRVVALSEGLLSTARRSAPLADAAVIPNGVDTTTFCPAPAHDPDDSPTRLLCACRLVRHKGVDTLLRALAVLPESVPWVLRVVGDGPQRQSLEMLAQELGIQNAITFAGYVPHARLAQEYRNADLFVLPTLTESFGQVITEAMACGLPVIASAVGGIPEIVHDGREGWLVPPAEPQALADAVAAAAATGTPGLRERGVENARAVARRYAWPAVAQRYLSIYKSACGGRESSGS